MALQDGSNKSDRSTPTNTPKLTSKHGAGGTGRSLLGSDSIVLPDIWPAWLLEEIEKQPKNWKFQYNPQDDPILQPADEYAGITFF